MVKMKVSYVSKVRLRRLIGSSSRLASMANHRGNNGYSGKTHAADLLHTGRALAELVNRTRENQEPDSQSRRPKVWAKTPRVVAVFLKVLAVVVIAWVALSDLFERDLVIVEPFLISSELQTKGYSDQILAARLAYNLAAMIREAKSSKGSKEFSLPLSTRLPDIELPAAHTSLKSIIRYVQEFPPLRYIQRLVGSRPTRVSGLALLEDGNVTLTISITRDLKIEAQEFRRSLKDMDRLLTDASQYVLREVEPYILAQYFYQNKEMNEALSQVQFCIYHDREHPHLARALWGAILIEQGEYREAIEKLEEAASSDNHKTARDSAIIYSTWGRALLLVGMTNDAIAKFEEAIRMDSEFAPPYNNLGAALWDQNNHPEAIKRFDEAIQRDPDFSYAYYNLAYAMSEEDKPFTALPLYLLAARINPRDPDVFTNLGELLMNSFDPPRHKEALEMLNQAITIDKNHARAWHNLGNYWITLGDDLQETAGRKPVSGSRNETSAKRFEYYTKGRDASLRAISLYEAQKHNGQDVKTCSIGRAKAYNNLASALEGLIDYPSAVNSYSRAIEICPEYWHAYLGKGDALWKLGRFDTALDAYETVLERTDPNHPKHKLARIRKDRLLQERNRSVALARRSKEIQGASSVASAMR